MRESSTVCAVRVVHSLYYGQAGALSIMNKAQRATDFRPGFFSGH